MDFKNFNQNNDLYIANPNKVDLPKLPPGSYTLEVNRNTGELYFKKFSPNYDAIIDLPSPEFDSIMTEVDIFLEPATQESFKEYGFLYKRPIMLHGTHGTGKTVIVNRVGEKVIQKGGIILFNPHPALLTLAYKILDDVQPETTTMVIFEEFDALLARFEGELLSLLDGEVQKNNIIYLATTNHYDKIPARLKRPGRFATIMQVFYPNAEARFAYLSKKLKAKDAHEIQNWVQKTEGLSIDELKETVLAVKCLKKTLDDSVARIIATKESATGLPFKQPSLPELEAKEIEAWNILQAQIDLGGESDEVR